MIGFDTNVLIHATDSTETPKHRTAAKLLEAAITASTALLPLQVLAEFYSVARRKGPLDAETARDVVEDWCQAVTIAPFGDADLSAAMRASREHKLTIWDALIWATCDRMGASILVTEDLQDGRTLGRVTFLNPFNPANADRLGLA